MRPLSVAERQLAAPTVSLAGLLSGGRAAVDGRTALTLADYTEEILASGFPGLRGLPPRALRAELDGYLDRAVDRDVPDQGVTVRAPTALRRWLAAYAASTATTTTYERLRDAATALDSPPPARATLLSYRHALESTWLIDPVPGWLPTRNRLRRLVTTPKHHLADPALAARLLRVDAPTLLSGGGGEAVPRDGVLLGALFESLVTLSVRVYAQSCEARVSHLRTKGGEREVDLVVEGEGGRVVAIEVKLGRAVGDEAGRHLRWLRAELGDDLSDAVIVSTGSEAYRRPDGIAVVPLALLGP
ncbi:MAG: ATP-binding protein [Kineosporiaceae bacterium]